LLNLLRKVIRQSGSRCALLLGIGEYPQPIELHLLDKAEQVLKVFLRLSGKAHNERRTDRHIRDATADLLNQGQDIPLSVRSPHPSENAILAVLQGHVDIFADLRVGSDRFQKLFVKSPWINIMKANPVNPLHFGDRKSVV